MKVNHHAPKRAEPGIRERDLLREVEKLRAANKNAVDRAIALQRKVEKLRAANKNAVDRAIALQRKVESLETLVASLRDPKPASPKVGP